MRIACPSATAEQGVKSVPTTMQVKDSGDGLWRA